LRQTNLRPFGLSLCLNVCYAYHSCLMYMRGSICKQDAPACLTGIFALCSHMSSRHAPWLAHQVQQMHPPNHFHKPSSAFTFVLTFVLQPFTNSRKLLCRLLLQQRIAEHYQSEASVQRRRAWQYGRKSAVIDIIFAVLTDKELTTKEHGFL